MTRALITRHGQAENNLVRDRLMGRSPASQLTDLGRVQARSVGARLAEEGAPSHIICSSLPRTAETAELIAAEIGNPPIESDDDFWEMSKGDWEGRMPVELPTDIQAEIDADPFGYRYGGGESYRDVWRRIGPAYDRWITIHDGRSILFVLHGDVMRALCYHLVRFPPNRIRDWSTGNCAMSECRHEPGGRNVMVRWNEGSP